MSRISVAEEALLACQAAQSAEVAKVKVKVARKLSACFSRLPH